MRALVKPSWAAPPVVTEIAAPDPGPHEVLVETIYAGLCHTDVSMASGTRSARAGYTPRFPQVLGHEFVGKVIAHGAAISEPPMGSRVVGSAHLTCRRCAHCCAGRSMLCPELRVLGLDVHGVFAARFVVPADNLVVLPDTVPDQLAALAEPFAVALHALDVGAVDKLAPDAPVAVVGPGAVGLLVVGALAGHETTVVGTADDSAQLALAHRLGAHRTAMAARDVDEYAGCYPVVFETAGHPEAVASALTLCSPGGTVVCVGLPAQTTPVDTAELARTEKALVGSRAYDLRTWHRIPDRLAAAPDLALLVSHMIDLDEMAQALRLVATREATKVLLRPG